MLLVLILYVVGLWLLCGWLFGQAEEESLNTPAMPASLAFDVEPSTEGGWNAWTLLILPRDFSMVRLDLWGRKV